MNAPLPSDHAALRIVLSTVPSHLPSTPSVYLVSRLRLWRKDKGSAKRSHVEQARQGRVSSNRQDKVLPTAGLP